MAIQFDGRAMVEEAKRLRAERLRAVCGAVENGRAYWGRLRVRGYNDSTGRVAVVDETDGGDGIVRSYVVALEAIEIR